jgi:hypothetical protein
MDTPCQSLATLVRLQQVQAEYGLFSAKKRLFGKGFIGGGWGDILCG